jgi:hypothetical protein
MITSWDAIPSADVAPLDAAPSPNRARLVKQQINSRTVIRSVTDLAVKLGATVLGWLPVVHARQEVAAVGSYWGNCASAGYPEYEGLCTGAPYDPSYCGGDGWFKNGDSGGYRWTPVTACGDRNAWIWDAGRVGWRCCDGMRYGGSGSGTFLICNAVAYRR